MKLHLLRAKKSSKSSARVRKASPVGSTSRTHKVKKGESLFQISLKYNVGMKELARANNLKNPKVLSVGQNLKIPGASGSAAKKAKPPSSSSQYVVVSGDTLSQIAKKNKTSIKKLRSLNPGLKTRIYPGQKLKVP